MVSLGFTSLQYCQGNHLELIWSRGNSSTLIWSCLSFLGASSMFASFKVLDTKRNCQFWRFVLPPALAVMSGNCKGRDDGRIRLSMVASDSIVA